MKRMKLLFFAACLFWVGGVNAQADLRIVSPQFSSIGTLFHNEIDSIPIIIYNDSSTTFLGTISISSSINGHYADSIDDTPGQAVYYPNSTETDTIAQGDSILRYLVVTGVTPPFIQGPNGLVVWPIVVSSNLNFVRIPDSLGTTVLFEYPAAINEPNDKNLKVYMLGQQLLIKGDGEHLLKTAVLYDVTGAIIHQQTVTTNGVVNMEPYSEGIYFAEITFDDNTRQVFKVFNAR